MLNPIRDTVDRNKNTQLDEVLYLEVEDEGMIFQQPRYFRASLIIESESSDHYRKALISDIKSSFKIYLCKPDEKVLRNQSAARIISNIKGHQRTYSSQRRSKSSLLLQYYKKHQTQKEKATLLQF